MMLIDNTEFGVGDVCLCRAPNGISRLVLLIDEHADNSGEKHDIFMFALMSSDVDMATDKDVQYMPMHTGLPRQYLVEYDMVGLTYRSQLIVKHGRMIDYIMGVDGLGNHYRGDILTTKYDDRYNWKKSEDRVAHDISAYVIQDIKAGKICSTKLKQSLTCSGSIAEQ
jgi:hypothetical protein